MYFFKSHAACMNSVVFHYFIDQNNSLLFDIPINHVEPKQQRRCVLCSFLPVIWIAFWIKYANLFSKGEHWGKSHLPHSVASGGNNAANNLNSWTSGWVCWASSCTKETENALNLKNVVISQYKLTVNKFSLEIKNRFLTVKVLDLLHNKLRNLQLLLISFGQVSYRYQH